MTTYRELLRKGQIILLDGGMGTLLQKYTLSLDDFDGCEGLNEALNLTRPDVIKEIHLEYLKAGAMAIETNSFGASRIKLAEYGKADQVYKLNFEAAKLAKEAIRQFDKLTVNQAQGETPHNSRFVIGTMGPTGKLPSSTDPILGKITFDELADVFEKQATALIKGGVDVLLLETQHDILEVKAAIFGCRKAIAASRKDIVLQVQVTIDKHGKMLYGTDILTAFNIVRDLGIDVFGINCSTGPSEMINSIQLLSEVAQLPLSVLPNAGMPTNKDGKALYPLTAEEFAETMNSYIPKYGLQIVGGCCGTRPEHIAALAVMLRRAQHDKLRHPEPVEGSMKRLPLFASPIGNLRKPITGKPYLIGERLNSQGSKKAKQMMLADDYDSLLDLARDQEVKGADLLDLCFAMTERSDEAAQLSRFTNLLAYGTNCPLCFDSTEPEALEAALKRYAGRPLINSINLESDKIHQILPLVKRFGVTTIALCIDENGMAKTTKEKVAIAKRIYKIAVNDYDLSPEQLMFDTLTFTLATGEKEYRNSAKETFLAIQKINKDLPGVQIVLGISNISFGLKPNARKILNLVYLHEAVKHGLNYAIFHATEYQPPEAIPAREYELARSLIYNESETALIDFIQAFEDTDRAISGTVFIPVSVAPLDIAGQIQEKILRRKREGLIPLLEEARKTQDAGTIINTILLPAMALVGEKMDRGEIILPFVLESAEVMKTALKHLEKYLDQSTRVHKGKIVLATVFGDVHDIGKNLVKTILANNGYQVIDLGKQVPVKPIIETAVSHKADAIALSALLVTTSKQMQEVVRQLHEKKLTIPVIIGGAAINEAFARSIGTINGQAYPGHVYYAKDAFSGLRIMEQIIHG